MHVSTDVGGTFTDFVVFDEKGFRAFKMPSTPKIPEQAITQGLEQLGIPPSTLSHGTTVGTNAVLERKGAKTAFITTRGFRDILTLGRQTRPKLYDLAVELPEPLVPREHCYEVSERINSVGEVLRPLDRGDLKQLMNKLKKDHIESVAVSCLFSFLNPDHERAIGKSINESCDCYVSLSSEVLPEFREYERGSTTALDAYIRPIIHAYISRLEKSLGSKDFYIMKSSGGVVKSDAIKSRPVNILLSGPAGGVAASKFLGNLLGIENMITFDMGGTSTDVSTIVDGNITWTSDGAIGSLPLKIPIVDIVTVGAGGGSVAWMDEGRALRVGPRSAGADPGPICYGRGGKEPTVTDADLLSGFLDREYFLGGKLPLDIDLAEEGVKAFTRVSGLDKIELLSGISRLVNSNMMNAIRFVLLKRGLDPRDFTLMAFGGAGPVHACALARELKIPRVIVPPFPGMFSAYGIMISDIKLHYTLSRIIRIEDSEPIIDEILEGFTIQGRKDLKAQDLNEEDAISSASLDLRYEGQSYEVNVPYLGSAKDASGRFHDLHSQRFGYSMEGEPVELVNIRMELTVQRRKIKPPKARAEKEVKVWKRKEVLFEGQSELIKTPMFKRDELPGDFKSTGPAIIVENGSTTFVSPKSRFFIDTNGSIIIEVV